MPSWLLYTIGVLVFAFGLLLSIALHEIGHMVPAKKFGVKVTQYMVGFGPTVFSRKRGDTEYGVKAIPLGGYIRMIGMVPPKKDGTTSRWPRRLATAVEDFRAVSRQEIDPQDEHRQFYRLTPGKKMIIMLGGPTMNLLIFLAIFITLIMTLGTPQSDNTTAVRSVIKCVVPVDSTSARAGTCRAGDPQSPALQGGLSPDDTFVSIDGTPIKSWDQLSRIIQASAHKPLAVVVRHKSGQLASLTITPTENRNYVSGSSTRTAVVGYIGFEPGVRNYFQTVGITGVPSQIGGEIKLGVSALARYPEKIKSLFGTVFEGKARDPNGAVGVVGIGRISGDYAQSNLLSVREKVYILLSLLAGVNLLLFFFNLLPLLPLDGGHVAGALVESAKRGRARLRQRREPEVLGPDGVPQPRAHRQIFVDTASMLPVMYAVASVLVVMTLLTLYADIVKPINVGGG